MPQKMSAADKSFGMKNKGGKKVAAKFQAESAHSKTQTYKKQKDSDKRAEAAALDSLLFTEAVKKKKKPTDVKKVEEKKVVEEPRPTELIEQIEYDRKRITSRTPVTLERLQIWLKEKKEAKAAEESKRMTHAKNELARGKRVGLTGKDLLTLDPTVMFDDDEADDDVLADRVEYDGEESEDEGEGGDDDLDEECPIKDIKLKDEPTEAPTAISPPVVAAASTVPAGECQRGERGASSAAASDLAQGSSGGSEAHREPGNIDLEGVDASLFLGMDEDDLPEDDE